MKKLLFLIIYLYFRLNEITKLLLNFTSSTSSFHSYITSKTREIGFVKAESGNLEALNESFQKAEVSNFLFS